MRRTVSRGLVEGTKGKRLVRSSVQTQGRSCVGGFIIECGAYSRIGAKDCVDTHRKSSRTEGAELGSCRWTPHRRAVSWAVPSGSSDDPRLMGRSSDAPRAQSIFRGADVRLVAPKDTRWVSLSTCWVTFSFVNTGRPGDKLMTASPFFEHGMHSTEWGRKTHHEPAPKTGLRAQLARGFHLTIGSLRVLATEPRLMALPFLALVFTGFVWLIVVLSVIALGLPPSSPSSGFLYQEIFVAYLLTYFLSVYFMAAIIGAAAIRLQGQRPYVLDGIGAANASFFQILIWSVLAGGVRGVVRFPSF